MEKYGAGCGKDLSKGDLVVVVIPKDKHSTRRSAFGLVTGLGDSTAGGGGQIITIAMHKSVTVPLVTSLKFVTSLQHELHQVRALISLIANPLCKHIINPADPSVFITKAFSSSKGKQNLPLKELVRIYKDDICNESDGSWPCMRLFDGPVGSGKTRFLASLISDVAQAKKRNDSKTPGKLLVCAPSNKALDMLIKEIWKARKHLTKDAKKTQKGAKNNVGGVEIVRFDLKDEAEPQLTYFLLPYLVEQERKNQSDNASDDAIKTRLLQRADIIGCTLTDCSSQMLKSVLEGNIFAVFVDDAAHCLETELLLALQYGATRVFLAGDQRQGIVNVRSQQSQDQSFRWSLLERLAKNFKPEDERIHRWEYQYRMKVALAEFPSAYFYGNGLQTDEKIFPANWKAFPIRPYVVFDVCDSEESQVDESLQNKAEAEFITELIKVYETVKPKETSLGIITPFQQQKKFLQQQLSKLPVKDAKTEYNIGTLDEFYGKEKNVIILSCAKDICVFL